MEVKAKARFIRMSPRKVRLVVDVVRGKSVGEARTQLTFLNKAAVEPVLKLLNSAVANAVHNFGLNEKDLVIKEIMADGGPTLSRWRARAMGRAAPIRKRTTHISITLEDKTKTPAPEKIAVTTADKEKEITESTEKKSEQKESKSSDAK
jgi:large subunit ribosomal protein L22